MDQENNYIGLVLPIAIGIALMAACGAITLAIVSLTLTTI